MTLAAGFTVSARGRRPLADRGELPRWLRTAHRSHLRLGSAVCARLLPDEARLGRELRWAREEGLGVELETPVVGDTSLLRLRELLIRLAEEAPDAEVCVNDWGVLRVLIRRGRSLRVTAGRLMHRQMRDPRVETLQPRDLGSDRWPGAWRWGSSSSPAWRELAAACGVGRVEVDWTFQGLESTGPRGFDVSLHLPFALVATGRTCLACGPAGPVDGYGADLACARECSIASEKLILEPGPPAVEVVRAGRAELLRHHGEQLERARGWLDSGQRGLRVVVSEGEC